MSTTIPDLTDGVEPEQPVIALSLPPLVHGPDPDSAPAPWGLDVTTSVPPAEACAALIEKWHGDALMAIAHAHADALEMVALRADDGEEGELPALAALDDPLDRMVELPVIRRDGPVTPVSIPGEVPA